MSTALLALLLAPETSPIPLAPGSSWEYQESYSEQHGDVAATEDAATRFRLTRGRRGLFLVQRGGADPVSGPVEQGPSWLRVLPWTGEDALPLPLEIGRVGPGSSDDHPGWTVEAEEEITVPAGVFRTLRCAIRTSTHISLLWIAPGVGVVKETHGTPRRRPEIERVLLRFKLGDKVIEGMRASPLPHARPWALRSRSFIWRTTRPTRS